MSEPTTMAELLALVMHTQFDRAHRDYPYRGSSWFSLDPNDKGKFISVSAEILAWLGLLGLHVQVENDKVVVHVEKRIVRAGADTPKTTESSHSVDAKVSKKTADYANARAKGYSGATCAECQGMRMVTNGRCEKCEDCGATTGCS